MEFLKKLSLTARYKWKINWEERQINKSEGKKLESPPAISGKGATKHDISLNHESFSFPGPEIQRKINPKNRQITSTEHCAHLLRNRLQKDYLFRTLKTRNKENNSENSNRNIQSLHIRVRYSRIYDKAALSAPYSKTVCS